VFGARTMHSLENGLEKMARWVQQHGSRKSSDFENIEILKNLPYAWLS
jgi:UDP-glucose 4-epimerase